MFKNHKEVIRLSDHKSSGVQTNSREIAQAQKTSTKELDTLGGRDFI